MINIDLLAEKISEWALIGYKLPPSWDGAKHSFPVCGPQRERIGDILPGRGLYLDRDLKSMGITRRIPHVFERTEACKLAEALGSERDAIRLIAFRDRALRYGCERTDLARAAITSYDGIISARAGGLGQDVFIAKASITSVANLWYSLMQAAAGTVAALSGISAGSGTPGAGGSVMTRATTGAWSLALTNPAAGHSKYLLTFGYTAAQTAQMLFILDFLVGVSGISSNSATNNVNTTALTRVTSGTGVWPVMECATPPSAGSFSWGGTYTGVPSGSTSFTATAAVSAQVASRVQPNATGLWVCPTFNPGDYGMTVCTTITTSAQFASGVFYFYMTYPLLMMPGLAANIYVERDSTVQIDGLVALPVDGSQVLGCLGALIVPSTTSTGILQCYLRTCEG